MFEDFIPLNVGLSERGKVIFSNPSKEDIAKFDAEHASNKYKNSLYFGFGYLAWGIFCFKIQIFYNFYSHRSQADDMYLLNKEFLEKFKFFNPTTNNYLLEKLEPTDTQNKLLALIHQLFWQSPIPEVEDNGSYIPDFD